MQFLCIAALLLSAVAANPDSWRPKQDENVSPTGGPKLDADSMAVTHTPEDGDWPSGDWPEWNSGHPAGLHEMPTRHPHKPSGRPENGISRGPVNGTDGNGHKPERPHQAPTRGKRQAPSVIPKKPGARHSGHSGKSKGPRRDRWANRRNPGKMVFSPVFKVNNMTFQNLTDVTLKEGENLFLLPKHGERGPRHHEEGKHGPPRDGQYVKLIYNATEPNKVTIEYGAVKQMALGEMVGEEDDSEEYY